MKKLLILFIVILAMAGISTAQESYCDGSAPPPGGCGYYDSSGFFVFTKCIAVNCQSDPNNCGGVGNKCTGGDYCSGGSCTCFGDPTCDGGIAPNQNSKVIPKGKKVSAPFRLKPLHWTRL